MQPLAYFLTAAAIVLSMFALPPSTAEAGGFALNLGVGRNNGFNGVGRANNFGNNGFVNLSIGRNRGLSDAELLALALARNNGRGHGASFNAFGTRTVVDARGNVFEQDAFGNARLVRDGFNSFNNFGGVRTFGGCR